MQRRMFDHIQSLDKSRNNWKIKARLARFWATFSPETSAIKGFNLILLDDDNSHIHAYVYPDNWRTIDKEVVEGNVYVIENFQVRETIGKLKPVSTRLCIRLLSNTVIEPVEDDVMIPKHKFEFMDMGDLLFECQRLTENQNPEFAYDVIGVVEHFKKVKRVQTRYGERDQSRFIFTDGRYNASVYIKVLLNVFFSLKFKVTLWGDLASSVSERFKPDLEKPVIGILTSAKLSTFREEHQIGALPSTKIFFNPAIDSVVEFRERLIEEGYKPPEDADKGTSEPPVSLVIEQTSFRDLIENSITYRDMRTVIIKFVISKIEDEENWWFNSCVSCQAEVEKVDKKFKCPECKRSFGYSEKRFRIVVLADDSTLVTNIILLDRFVKRVAGTTVANILNEIKKDSSVTVLSTLFKTIIGKEVTVLIKLTDANVDGDSNLYNIVDLCDSATEEVAIVQASPSNTAPSFSMDGVVPGIELFQTPGSSQSVTKKIKMEGSKD
ncbi:replication protein A 70 kDa DNA-binding subunit C [Daucus carota subsp. sativus]|uniref:replication protein A 70 kDa DNA-binding subunit C n=1 Tax=Daucus carota subsp. sativus TaxID=79200 RepID=UPI0007F03944|nr:PREDICTED: replication protein A 70 kDa DNA-binding subunit C-like [Daucus carota subsp. sativus]